MFLKTSAISQENTCVGVSKVRGPQNCNFIKKRLQHRYFHVKFLKLLRTTILKNIWERLLLFYQKIRVYVTRTQTIHAAVTWFFNNKMWYFFFYPWLWYYCKLQNTAATGRDFPGEIRSGVYWVGMEWLFGQKRWFPFRHFKQSIWFLRPIFHMHID